MKFKQAWLILAVVGAVAACSSEHQSPTGSYGQAMLSGRVVVTEVENTSPAGVRVSVRGTGMAVTLAGDGQFAFAGVPEGAELDFIRAEDGIEASLKLEEGQSFVVVELARSNARKSSRRRGVGSTRERVYELEGLIRSAAADSIVVYTSHKAEVTIALTPDTVIRKGNQILTPADLVASTRVHVKARKVADSYSAILVIVQEDEDDDGEDDPPAVVREYEGIVRSAAAGQLVVFTSHKEEVTFVLTAETVIRKGSRPLAPTDILPGMRVHVKATVNAGGTTTANLVIVQDTRVEAEIEGTVASVGTSSLVVTTGAGDMTVNVSNSTQIRKSGKKISLGQVAVGDQVEVEGTLADATTIDAKRITVED